MFRLSDDDLAGRTLGCGDGPASFNAEATAAGHNVVSCDPTTFRRRGHPAAGRGDHDGVIPQVKLHPEKFVWAFHR